MSLEQISPIIQRKIPFHLEELRIENCKIEKDVTLKLLKILNEKSYIQKLGLVDIGIEEEAFKELCSLVSNNTQIVEIDIRKTQVKPLKFLEFIKIVHKNRKIQDLNIADNLLLNFEEISEINLKKDSDEGCKL